MSELVLRHPTVDDGLPVWRLVRDGGVLDLNSSYAYCATFRHFPRTCVVAEDDGAIAGFVTGYRIPERPDVLFVWQVGVAPTHRGRGLATQLLRWLVTGTEARWLETTITPSNQASQHLFRGLARRLETGCEVSPGLSSVQLGSDHEAEELYRIGPFHRSKS